MEGQEETVERGAEAADCGAPQHLWEAAEGVAQLPELTIEHYLLILFIHDGQV